VATELEVGGRTYSIGKLDTFVQFHVGRRVAPLLRPILESSREGGAKIDVLRAAVDVSEAMSTLPNEQLDYVLKECLSVVRVKQENRFTPLMANGQLLFQDLGLAAMLQLTGAVLRENFQDFFAGLLGGP